MTTGLTMVSWGETGNVSRELMQLQVDGCLLSTVFGLMRLERPRSTFPSGPWLWF